MPDETPLPEWVRDPERAYEEIRRLRQENAAARVKLNESEDWRSRFEAAQEALRSAERDAAQMRIAGETGLPPAMAARLQGGDDEALRRDAETLKALLATQPPARGQGAIPVPGGMPQGETDEQRRARLFGRGTVNPIFEKR